MPIPSPKGKEKKEDFISRCMGNSVMQEYEQKQRAAICYSAWRKAKKARGEQITEDDYHPSELQPEQEQEIKDAVKEMFPPETEEKTDENN